ncbi:hypothetical protein L6452_34635 [Arctium lappa]|uniref:Uncharacterized protein n=1 Tax=Arctium lappa TaxID=4217 RepID=A0ACB8YJ03_ARCLA|nr:hypothetical protein L6452_34635 [Arctium lappa]
MSHSNKPVSELGFDNNTLSDRLRKSLTTDDNKPNFRELDSGSPISPLRVEQTVSTSSNSFGSVSGRTLGNGLHVRSSVKSGHVRSESGGGTTIFTGGNICPSGRVLKTGMISNRTLKSDVLSLETGSYGHGSIMRGGSAVAGGRGENPVSSNSNHLF